MHDSSKTAKVLRDSEEANGAESQEEQRLEGLHPVGAAHAAKKCVDADHNAKDQASDPLVLLRIAGQVCENRLAAQEPGKNVRGGEEDQNKENDSPQRVGLPAVTKVLHLGDVAE